MNETSKVTLASIEALLVSEMASPHEALQAAYQLGRIDGQLEMANIGEGLLKELTKEPT